MKALFAKGELRFDLRDVEIPIPRDNEVLVKVKACGLCGTDLHFAKDWQGDFMPLGHEIAGEVVESGKNVSAYKPGDMVIVEDIAMCGMCADCKEGNPHLCRNGPVLDGQPGMSEYLAVDQRLLNKLDGMDYVEASLVEPCAVAINTTINAQIPLGGKVAVFGPGPIGLMCVRLAKLSGASKAILIGTSVKIKREAARFKVGEEMGAEKIIEADESDAVEVVKEYFGGGADCVIVTSPPKTIEQAIRMVKFGGTVSFAGINLGGKSKIEIDVNELIFNKITLKPTFAEPALRFPTAVRLIREGVLDAKKIISHTFTFDQAEDLIRMSLNGSMEVIKAVLLPNGK